VELSSCVAPGNNAYDIDIKLMNVNYVNSECLCSCLSLDGHKLGYRVRELNKRKRDPTLSGLIGLWMSLVYYPEPLPGHW